MTSEVEDGGYITEFISLGPKNYGYRTSSGQEIVKCRGFTLNFKNSQLITLDSMKELLLKRQEGHDEDTHINIINPSKITRDLPSVQLYNRLECKKYSMVYRKRLLLQDTWFSVPYGYRF